MIYRETTGKVSIPDRCSICDRKVKSALSLILHNSKQHQINGDETRLQLAPQVYCNCGKETRWNGYDTGYDLRCSRCNKIIAINEIAKTRRENYKPAWNHGLTKETNESIAIGTVKMSKTKKELHIPSWSKGLTKETDERLRKISLSLIGKNVGELHWSYGLTSENDERIRKRGESISRALKSGMHWTKGQNRQLWIDKLSATRKRRFQEGLIHNHTRLSIKQLNDLISQVNNWDVMLDPYPENYAAALKLMTTSTCKSCGRVVRYTVGQVSNDPYCICKPNASTSIWEKEVGQYVLDLGFNVHFNVRDQLEHGYELDIHIPTERLAIECNGVYYHSEIQCANSLTYHEMKRQFAIKNGIRLLQFYDDEWYNKPQVVKSIISSVLNKSLRIIDVERCSIEEISQDIAEMFFENCHLDDFVESIFTLGLIYDDELVCAISVKTSNTDSTCIEIAQYAIGLFTSIPGGFAKLISRIEDWCHENTVRKIRVIQDSRLGMNLENNDYVFSNFKLIETTSPNWWWTDHHDKFDMSCTELKNSVQHDSSLGYDKIGGCANFIFEKNISLSSQESALSNVI